MLSPPPWSFDPARARACGCMRIIGRILQHLVSDLGIDRYAEKEVQHHQDGRIGITVRDGASVSVQRKLGARGKELTEDTLCGVVGRGSDGFVSAYTLPDHHIHLQDEENHTGRSFQRGPRVCKRCTRLAFVQHSMTPFGGMRSKLARA